MRLIDADAMVAKTEVLYQHTSSGKIIPWSAVRVCEINNIPTIDAEPVVRCKDCKYSYECFASTKHLGCRKWDAVTVKHGFCNMGAKIDGGAEE